MLTSDIIFKSFPVGPLQCNCSIIGDPISKKALIIDPGGDVEKIISTLKNHELNRLDNLTTGF